MPDSDWLIPPGLPHPPLFMGAKPGAIFAMSGGSFGEHRDSYDGWDGVTTDGDFFPVTTTPVDSLVVQAARSWDTRSVPRLLLVTTASEDGRHDVDLIVAALRRQYEALGAEVDELRGLGADDPDVDEAKKKIDKADAIYVLGGNSDQMMKVWRRTGVAEHLYSAWQRGAVMTGQSAGAICWSQWGCSNSYYTNRPFKVHALGLIDLAICPHADVQPFREPEFRKQLRDSPFAGLALDEHATLEVVSGHYRVHATEPGAAARLCWWIEHDTYAVRDIMPSVTYRPLSELTSPKQ